MACCCEDTQNGRCCSKMLIQVNRVFNGARIETHTTENISLSDFSPALYTPPLTYISTLGEGVATVLSQTVSPLNDGRQRVRITYSVPLTVTMRDAANITVTAQSAAQKSLDVILVLPTKPYTFEVAVAYMSRIGDVHNDNVTATITGCLLTILKVLIKCEIIICPCGCATYPDAVLTEEVSCNAVFAADI